MRKTHALPIVSDLRSSNRKAAYGGSCVPPSILIDEATLYLRYEYRPLRHGEGFRFYWTNVSTLPTYRLDIAFTEEHPYTPNIPIGRRSIPNVGDTTLNRATAPIPFAGSLLDETRHVCAFFHNDEEEYRTLLSFIKDGFHCGHKAIHVVNPDQRQKHSQRLVEAGIDPVAAQKSGQLDLRINTDV